MWKDNGLSWDPKKYGGIEVIRLPHDLVWKPDIFLYNNADISTYYSSLSSNMIVASDGNVTWLSMVIFKSTCSINVRYFPFDEQNCSMTFASWTYDGFQVNLSLTTTEGDISNYIKNSEWSLQKLYVERNVMYYSCCAEPYPDITFYIYIRRRPLFYIFNMIMPCILITLVALLGFYIPSDSGEKVTMGITTLLSMTVFMMLVAENMPPTSNVLPLIGIYYGITISIVSTATGMTVFTLNIHHKGHRGRQVPQLIKRLCHNFFAKILCIRLEHADYSPSRVYIPSEDTKKGYLPFTMVSDKDQMDNRNTDDIHPSSKYCVNQDRGNGKIPCNLQNNFQHMPAFPDMNKFENQLRHVLQKVCCTIENNEKRQEEQDRRDVIKMEWQQIAQIVDRVLLSIFVVVTLTVTIVVMVQGPAMYGSQINNDIHD
ncbi:CHRNN [Mytilus edulis]|uniref:CHRNN n=1 Tax=Mytilus edulis TaxID=6550 RepID=A0A8S3UZU8_MYTED|nr:CHRNN [Mytilus edulis]